MKIGLEEFLELNVNELIAVNGGSSGSCSGSTGIGTGAAGDSPASSGSPGTTSGTSGGSGGSCSGAGGGQTKTTGGGTATASGTCSGSTQKGKDNPGGGAPAVPAGDSTAGTCGGTTPKAKDDPTGGNPGLPAGGDTAGTCSGTNTNTSQSESIADSINNHSNESYVKGENDCDIWVQNVLQDAGYDISDEWGDAANYNVDDHEQLLAGKTSNTPDSGWNVVLMTEHKSTNNYISHSALIDVNSDGSCTLYQHSSSSPSVENYSSVGAFQNAYGYNDFDYYNIRQ